MLNKKSCIAWVLGACSGAFAQPQGGGLQGDAKTACEVILCLAAVSRPAECVPPIRRFFSISFKRFSDTLRGRANFLNLCPTGTAPEMEALKSALVNGAGRCDAASINAASWISYADGGGEVSASMPQYCAAFMQNAYTSSMVLPRYVGEPKSGGHWVEARDYEGALRAYTQTQEAKAIEQQTREQAN